MAQAPTFHDFTSTSCTTLHRSRGQAPSAFGPDRGLPPEFLKALLNLAFASEVALRWASSAPLQHFPQYPPQTIFHARLGHVSSLANHARLCQESCIGSITARGACCQSASCFTTRPICASVRCQSVMNKHDLMTSIWPHKTCACFPSRSRSSWAMWCLSLNRLVSKQRWCSVQALHPQRHWIELAPALAPGRLDSAMATIAGWWEGTLPCGHNLSLPVPNQPRPLLLSELAAIPVTKWLKCGVMLLSRVTNAKAFSRQPGDGPAQTSMQSIGTAIDVMYVTGCCHS